MLGTPRSRAGGVLASRACTHPRSMVGYTHAASYRTHSWTRRPRPMTPAIDGWGYTVLLASVFAAYAVFVVVDVRRGIAERRKDVEDWERGWEDE